MAAADYYHAGPPPGAQQQPNPTFLAPPPQPQRASSHPGYVYPPYQPQTRPPSYQPAPVPTPPHPPYAHIPPQRNSFSHPQRPDPQTWNHSFPPPPTQNHQIQYQPQQFAPPPRQEHRPSYSQPYLHPEAAASFSSGYVSDPEPHRRRHHHTKKSKSATRSTATDGFLGAAGGGLIGDLIFPGLGTVGGALAGWIGGKEFGEHRRRRDSKLEEEQRQWEDKFDPDGRRRSGDHDRSRTRKHSHDSGRH